MKPVRIHQLDNIVANQIAAGEVVERPASVVKELVENSIDAGATRIDIDIEKGGAALIRVKDNGCGIHPDDLTLALNRHATSKIKHSDDLSAIETLGFRGEALASISSVSRLILTSRSATSDHALQAEAQGRDMDVVVSTAGLNQGTLVEVRELFFNTPARRRFMRTDKTEFRHIETVVHRIVLSHPNISFLLKHNGRKIRHFISAEHREAEEHRVGQILGKEFLQNCIHFSLEHEVESSPIKFCGWLGLPDYHRSMNDGQFVFVNGRAVKDPVISHAIREAYGDKIPKGRLPAYIIDIQILSNTVDVNVHPTKHEVRFQYQRMVHDLIIRALSEVLNEASINFQQHRKDFQPTSQSAAKVVSSYPSKGHARGSYQAFSNMAESASGYDNNPDKPTFSELSTGIAVADKYLLLSYEDKLLLVSLPGFIQFQWPVLWQKTKVLSAPVLFPPVTAVSQSQLQQLQQQQQTLTTLGLEIFLDLNNAQLKLLTIPNIFSGVDVEIIFTTMLSCLEQQTAKGYSEEFSKKLATNLQVSQSISNYYQFNNPLQVINWFEKNKPDNFSTDENPCDWITVISVKELDKLLKVGSE